MSQLDYKFILKDHRLFSRWSCGGDGEIRTLVQNGVKQTSTSVGNNYFTLEKEITKTLKSKVERNRARCGSCLKSGYFLILIASCISDLANRQDGFAKWLILS